MVLVLRKYWVCSLKIHVMVLLDILQISKGFLRFDLAYSPLSSIIMRSQFMGFEVGGRFAIGGKLFCPIGPPTYSSSWRPNLPIVFVKPWYNLASVDDVGECVSSSSVVELGTLWPHLGGPYYLFGLMCP